MSPQVDPITLEIIRGSLASTIRDMELLMERCAMSPFIKEKKDYFVGVFDTRGRIVACHISGSGPGMLEPIVKIYPLETMRPGDVYWFNDPYISDGAVQHHQDMVFTAPIFHEGSLVAFAATFGHYQDIGGLRAGSISPHATEIYHEGVLVPPVRIVREGQLNEEAYRIFLRNSRLPDLVEGDTRAMMASCHLADTRVAELCGRYGAATVLAAFDECIAQTAVRARELFLQLVPQGKWSFHDFLDSDGGADQRPFRVELELSRTGDHVRLDGSRSDDQARGPINFTTNAGLLRIAFGRYLQSLDADLDVNEGLLRNLDEWIAREGSILKPRFPAPLGMRANTRFRVMSCIFGSLAQANGGRVPAGSPVYVLYYFRAWDEARARPILCIEGLGVGLGARPFADGVDVIYYIAQENYPVEYVERDFPLRVERYAAAAAASFATCACSARRRSWPRGWRTRWSRPTAWPAGVPGGPGASRSTPARRRSARSLRWATASCSSVAISSVWRRAAAAAGAIRSSATPSACVRTWRAASSPGAGLSRTMASCWMRRRSISTRRPRTRRAAGAPATCRTGCPRSSLTAVPASTRRRRAGAPPRLGRVHDARQGWSPRSVLRRRGSIQSRRCHSFPLTLPGPGLYCCRTRERPVDRGVWP
jgi:N-methylhydantoinase B